MRKKTTKDKPKERKSSFQKPPYKDQTLKGLIDFFSDWTWEQDSEFRFTRFDGTGIERIFDENPVGKRPHETGLEIEGGWETHRILLETHQGFRDVIMHLELSDGNRRYFSVSGEPVFDERGHFAGYRGLGRDITERQELLRLRAAIDVSNDMIYLIDRSTMRFLYANETACRLSGYTREEHLQIEPEKLFFIDRIELELAYDKVISAGPEGVKMVMRTRTKDGLRSILEIHRRALRLGDRWIIVSTSHDISQRYLAEEAVGRLSRMYTALSATNEAIMRAQSPEELFQQVCDAAVDGGKFITAAVFLPDLPNPWMKMVAASGIGLSELGQLRFPLESTIPEGKGLIGTTFRNCKPYIVNDNLNDEILKNGSEEGKKARMAAAVPLLGGDQAIGVLLFRSEEKRGFNDEVLNLLERMAHNVVFALDNFEHEAERKQMEETLRQSEERYRTLIEEMEEWYFETDLTGKILFFNDAISRALGHPQENLTGLNFRTFFTPEETNMLYETFHRVYENGQPIKNFPYRLIQPDGNILFAEVSVFSKRDQEGKIIGFPRLGMTSLRSNAMKKDFSTWPPTMP